MKKGFGFYNLRFWIRGLIRVLTPIIDRRDNYGKKY